MIFKLKLQKIKKRIIFNFWENFILKNKFELGLIKKNKNYYLLIGVNNIKKYHNII